MSSQPLGGFAGWGFPNLNSAFLGQMGKDTGSVVSNILPLMKGFLPALGYLSTERSGRSPPCKQEKEILRTMH